MIGPIPRYDYWKLWSPYEEGDETDPLDDDYFEEEESDDAQGESKP